MKPKTLKKIWKSHFLFVYLHKTKCYEKQIFVGQILYREICNRYSPTQIKAYTVSKIGKKYFYLVENAYPINIKNLMYEDKTYSQANFRLYRTEQEILDRIEKSNLFEKIRKGFDWSTNTSNFTLEQLRNASKILDLS
jgi:hypothetical protein